MGTPDPSLNLVVVLETTNQVLLNLAQAALKETGINFALNAPASPEFGFTPIVNPVSKILVAEKDAPRAREIVERLLAGPEPSDRDHW